MTTSSPPARAVGPSVWQIMAIGLLLPTVTGCDNLPLPKSAADLARQGDPKACTHTDTVALAMDAIRGKPGHVVTTEELEAIEVSVSHTVMLSLETNVSVTCQTWATITGQPDSSFAYTVVPETEGPDIQLRWSERNDALGSYVNAWYDWKEAQAASQRRESPREPVRATEPLPQMRSADPPAPQPAGARPQLLRPTDNTRPFALHPVAPTVESAGVAVSQRATPAVPTTDAPVWLAHPRVAMPQAAINAGVNGSVTLQCTVTTGGALQNCRVLAENPIGYGLAQAALQAAISTARLRPRMVDGVPTTSTIAFTTRFASE